MPSRLLIRLDAAIEAERDLLRKDCLRAERAGTLARYGNVGQARRIVNELRTRSRRAEHPELAVWLTLAEGMAEFFESLSQGARPRFLRAHAVARAAGLRRLQGLAAAWLAITELNACAWASMVEHTAEALAIAEPGDHQTRARVAVTLARAYSRAGLDAQAEPWYRLARDEANSEGDTSMLSVMLFSRAAIHVFDAHLREAIGQGDATLARQVLLEAESLKNFDAGLGNTGLPDTAAVLHGLALTTSGHLAEGGAILQAHLPAARQQGFEAVAPRLLAEIAWCQAQGGQAAAAQATMSEALSLLSGDTEADDRAATFARQAALAAHQGDTAAAEAARAATDQEMTAFRALQADIAGHLHGKAPPLPPRG